MIIVDCFLLHFSVKKVMTCFSVGFMDTGTLCFWGSGVTSWFCGGGSEHSGNNSPISNFAFFLVYFLGASCSFPTSSAIYLSAFISNYSLRVGRRNMKTEDKTAVLLPLLNSM